MITLVMLSGGLDSAYVLAKLLRETDDDIIAHHIHLITSTARHKPEAESCRKIVDFCQNEYRPFEYTFSTIDRRGYVYHGKDLISAAFEAGAISASYLMATGNHVNRWTVGISLEDNIPDVRFRNADKVCRSNCTKDDAPDLFLLDPISQQETIDYLPYNLYKMTWSCRIPQEGDDGSYSPCGDCGTCRRLNDLTHMDEKSIQ